MPDSVAPAPRRPLCRRRFLGLLGAAGATLVGVRHQEILDRGCAALVDLCEKMDLPQITVSALVPSADLTELLASPYAAFLGEAGFRHLSIETVLAPHANRHGKVQNSLPPRALWANIVPTLRVADRLARELGEKARINSVYRSPAYNATCPGAARWSQHLQNRAIDIRFSSPPAVVARLARRLREGGLFSGGVGVYPSFVHIDTRGKKADWAA